MSSQTPVAEHSSTRPPLAQAQFSLSTLLWLTATVGIALAYLRLFGTEATLRGMIVVGFGLAIGGAWGLLLRRVADGIYWSVLGAFLAYLCTLGVAIPHWSLHYAWGLVGAAAGAAAGACFGERPVLRMAIGTVAGALAIALFSVWYYVMYGGGMLVDALVAPIAGALLAAVIEAITWLERRRRPARNFCAAGLILAVIVGNIVAARVVAGW